MADTIKASHILVDDEHLCNELLEKIKSGANFEDLAKEYSKCPSGQKGGDLGSFGKGQMVQAFEDVAMGLDVGQVSGVVGTRFGFHIIKRTG